jgi:hypothetical protein
LALLFFAILIVGYGVFQTDLLPLFKNLFASNVAIASFFGFCGGIVSLLLRLPEFEVLKGKSREFLMAIGATQPIIGVFFAFVLGALFSAKIINISIGGSSGLSPWFFVVLGFLAGFSERFTKKLLNVAESHLGGPAGPS